MKKIAILSHICKSLLLISVSQIAMANNLGVKPSCVEAVKKFVSHDVEDIPHDCSISKKLVTWLQIQNQSKSLTFNEVVHFIKESPDWPNKDLSIKVAERSIKDNVSPHTLITWFKENPPQTVRGATAYINALMASGRMDEAKKQIAIAWINRDLDSKQFQEFKASFGKYLTQQNHADRVNRLLWDDEIGQARQMMVLLNAKNQQIAEIRMSLKGGNRVSIPADLGENEGIRYDQALSLKRQGRFDEARDIIVKTATASDFAENWWAIRHYIAREYFEEKRFKEAAQIMENHKLKDGENFANAEWTLGWVKLRFLKSPKNALEHFTRLSKAVKSPISLSRAYYWMGRAYEEMGNKVEAAKVYADGAKYKLTFYGQLSAIKIRHDPHPKLASSTPSSSMISHELSTAIKVLSSIGDGGSQWIRPFVIKLSTMAKSDADKHSIVHMISQFLPSEVVWSAKKMGGVESHHAFPKIARLPKNSEIPEHSFIHSIAYQESRFDHRAVSTAGAMGLMQLMPKTASRTAKAKKIKHTSEKQLFDPAHNATIGSYHLGQMMDKYGGHYAMASAAYNASEEKVDKWIAKFGDPRRGEIDIVDWVELIPYYETRNYVQRVLENIPVYGQVLTEDRKRNLANYLEPAAAKQQ